MRLKNSLLKIIYIAIFIVFYIEFDKYIKNKYLFDFLPKLLWMYFWTFLLGIYFASDNIKNFWKSSGQIHIDYGYLAIAMICIFFCFFAFPLFGFYTGMITPALSIILWHSILSLFYKAD